MFSSIYTLIWSENPDKLMEFYRDILELTVAGKVDIPEISKAGPDYGYEMKSGDLDVCWIGIHSEVKGKSKEPVRIMHNLRTNEVQKWFDKVKEYGCEILLEPVITPFSQEEDPTYVCTWLDPEGNCWQFMGSLGG